MALQRSIHNLFLTHDIESKNGKKKRYKRHCIFSLMKYIPQTVAYFSCDFVCSNSWPCGGDSADECVLQTWPRFQIQSFLSRLRFYNGRLHSLLNKLVVVIRCKGKQTETVLNRGIKGAPSSLLENSS